MMPIYYRLDDNNVPIEASIEALLLHPLQDFAKTVAWSEPLIGTHVSTRFLGFDTNGSTNGYPICFETLVQSDSNLMNGHGARYHTWDAALEGHKQWCEKVLQTLLGEQQ